jgi:hypothetical protein
MDVIRPHVVLILGKRGCLSGETKVFTNHGFKEIKDFDEKDDRVYSYNNNSFEWENAQLLKYPINETLIKFELADGQVLVMTNEHPLLVFDGKKTLWKEARNICSNDFIVSTTSVPEVKNDKESLRIARLLGFILADGTMNIRSGRWKDGRGYWYNGYKRRLRIFHASENVLRIAKDDLEKEFEIKVKRYKRSDCNCEVVETKQGKVVEKFKKLGVPLGSKAGIIRIPKVVWESSNEFKSNFINALFSCDGYINKTADVIEYYSKSKEFLIDLHLLLQHFNIHSKIKAKKAKCKEKYYDNYRLTITDNTSLKNFKNIGFFDTNKERRLESYIPDINRINKRRTERRKKTIYLSNQIFCQKIKNISKVGGINEVYDLSVPKNHSFIANGIISHNSGKSYSAGVIAEEITSLPEEIKQNLACLMVDTMGIFWSMKNPNDQDVLLLNGWGLKPKAFPVRNIVPVGLTDFYDKAGISYDGTFSVKPSELSVGDWALTFDIDILEPLGILLERVIKKLVGREYSIKDIINEIEEDKRSEDKEKLALENRFIAAEGWGIFSTEATPIEEFLKPGAATVLDVSLQEWSIRNLMLGILIREIYQARMSARREEELAIMEGEFVKKIPMTWIIIDEAENFIPARRETAATHDILTLLRQGRQPGISLVLITQRPNRIHEDSIAQADLVISHRLTAKPDLEALSAIMQTYLLFDIKKSITELPKTKGSALVLDDNSERLFNIQVRPRMSWHAGGSPVALKEKAV